MERHSRGVTQVCGVLCLLYGYAVEAVLFIAIVDGGVDTLQRQSGRIGLPEHITSSSTQLRAVASVFKPCLEVMVGHFCCDANL